MDQPLVDGLREVAALSPSLQDPWWLIGSAAMALAGLEGLDVADIDLLVSERDAAAALSAWLIPPEPPGGNDRFCSLVYGRRPGALVIEVMAGLQVKTPRGWTAVRPQTRRPVGFGGAALYIPETPELIAICRLFGRPKDLERARALEALAG
jgi:hypothetical protein